MKNNALFKKTAYTVAIPEKPSELVTESFHRRSTSAVPQKQNVEMLLPGKFAFTVLLCLSFVFLVSRGL